MCKKYILNRRLLVPEKNPNNSARKLVTIEKGSCYLYCDELNTPNSCSVALCRRRTTSSERVLYHGVIIMNREEFKKYMTEEREC